MTDATLLRGCLGMFSFFIAPVTALINVVNLSKLTSLPAPDPNSSVRPPADPGQGLFRRPGVYVYVGVIAIVMVYFVLVLRRLEGPPGSDPGGRRRQKAVQDPLRELVDRPAVVGRKC